jgi:phosphopantothenoylcysteine synthetase/decarboxylase
VQHDALGYELLEKLAVDLEDTCLKEGKPKKEGRNLSVILGPKPDVVKALSDAKRKEIAAKKKEREASLNRKRVGESAEDSLAQEVAAAARRLAEEVDEDDDEDDDDDLFDDDDDDDDDSLDTLLGSDESIDALFS